MFLLNNCDFKLTGFFSQKLVKPTKIEKWAVVNFSARCDVRGLVRDLLKCGQMKGIVSSAVTCLLRNIMNLLTIFLICV